MPPPPPGQSPTPARTWTGGLAVGASAAITYTVTVNNPDTGDKLLDNNVTSTTAGNNCPEGSTDPACTVTVRDLIPALTITKTADTSVAAPDATVDYTITVDNTGQTPYTGATVTDDLTGVLDEATYRGGAAATAGSVSFASPDLTWTGDLAVGASAAIIYSVTVNNAITNDLDLGNTVTSAAPGSNCPTGSTDPACSVTVFLIRGVLSITAPSSADLGATAPGGATNADLGTITVTDNRAIVGATWTATVSSTDFTTGGATAAETIPAGDAIYVINTLGTTTGSATFTPTPVTGLSTTSQTVVTATNADGENSAAWDPAIQVSVPSGVVGGAYSATITHSVS